MTTVSVVLLEGLWSGLIAAGLGVLFTAPRKYLVAAFACGWVGRCIRDLCIAWGVSHNYSTMLAAAVVVLVAVAIVQRRQLSPVVLVCAVIPLGASVAVFNLIFALIRLSTAAGDARNEYSLAFTSNLASALITFMAIALGLGGGMAIVRLLRREDVVNV
jgi:uncharacterized membrane protein YjjB (DUF3815 family)